MATDICQLIARVRAHGGDLQPLEDCKLSYRGPPLHDELRSLIRNHKFELIRALTAEAPNEALQPCLAPSCTSLGYLVELTRGVTTYLCAPHRRELFRHAYDLVESPDAAASKVFALRPCRFCGREVPPEDDPCTNCVALRSPAVRFALQLGAQVVCDCGSPVSRAGDTCANCRSNLRPSKDDLDGE